MSDKTIGVGERIRRYREHAQMDVGALADKAGVSERVVEAIESGAVYPALGVLVRLARALGQRLGTFTDDQFSPDPIVVRADAGKAGDVSHKANVADGFRYVPLGVGKSDRHMEPFRVEIAAEAEPPLASHEGEEFIVVLDGAVELSYGGEARMLRAGDSAYYNSVVPHAVKAAEGRPASIYAVVCLPF